MTPLTDIEEGATVRVTGLLNAPCPTGERGPAGDRNGRARLSEMGFFEGQEITVLKNRGNDPLVVRIRDIRMMLGRELAMKILIRGSRA